MQVKTEGGGGDQPKENKNKWISTGKNRGWVSSLRKRENKWISRGKNRGGESNLRKRENKWISTGKNRGGGPT